MEYRENGVAQRGVAVILAATLSVGMVPAMALANGNSDSGDTNAPIENADTALDPANLADGTYTVTVNAKQSSDTNTKSMMDEALVKPATLTVKDGQYTFTTDLQAVEAMEMTLYAANIQYYTEGATVTGNTVAGSGELKDVTVTATQEADSTKPKTITFPLADSVKTNGYSIIKLQVPGAPMPPVTTALQFDWSTLKAEGGSEQPGETVSKDALNAEITAAKAIEQGSAAAVDFALLQNAIASAQTVADNKDATQAEVDAATATLKTAVDRFNGDEGYNFQADRFYQVPVNWVSEKGEDYSKHVSGLVNNTVGVYYDGTTYSVYLTVTSEKVGAVTAYGDDDTAATLFGTDANGNRTYELKTTDLTKALKTLFNIPDMPSHSSIAAYMVFDTAKATDNLNLFNDVSASDWFAASVAKAKLAGYMSGYQDDNGVPTGFFGPYDSTTRAQAAAVLFNYAGAEEPSEGSGFDDVPASGEWYSGVVAWAKANGVVSGYEGTNLFGPNDTVTREQFAAILFNYAGVSESDVKDVDETLAKYGDAAQVDGWAKAPVAWAVQQGIMGKNTDTNTVNPLDPISRAEMAAMITDFKAPEKPEPGVQLEEGKEYTVPVSFYKTGTDEASSAAGQFAASADVTVKDGKYVVKLAATKSASAILLGVTYGADNAKTTESTDADGVKTYEFTIDSLDGRTNIGFSYDTHQPNLGDNGVMTHYADLTFDVSKAEEVK